MVLGRETSRRGGPLSDDSSQGNIGLGFLRPFRLILDYANERAAFLPAGSEYSIRGATETRA
jgi:hypothetical protein